MQAGGTAGHGLRKDEKGGQARDQLTTEEVEGPEGEDWGVVSTSRGPSSGPCKQQVLSEFCRVPGSVAFLRRPGGCLVPRRCSDSES